MSDTEENQEKSLLKVPFSSLLFEGEWLMSRGEYKKALEYFTTALTLKPGDKKCFIGRSKCFMKTGKIEEALKEAEASLEGDQSYYEGFYQKAEALYHMGNFPLALVFYHRGKKIRPQMENFTQGIQKAQDAIMNVIGTISTIKPQAAQTEKVSSFSVTNAEEKTTQSQKSLNSEKASRNWHGELSKDKKFLEDLMKRKKEEEKDFVSDETKHGETEQDIIQNSLTLIHSYTELLNQEKLLPPQEQKCLHAERKSTTVSEPPQFELQNIDINIEYIDSVRISGNADGSLKKAKELLKVVQKWSEKELPNKWELLGSLHSCIGNALFDLGDMDKALKHYQKGLELAKMCKLPDAACRALDNMGRNCVEKEDFSLAIEFFETEIVLGCNDLEKTCLFHNTGCCYVELEQYEEARKYGLRSVAAADEIADEKWQMYANVLVAVTELKLGNFESSVSHLEKATIFARAQEDDPTLKFLQKTLDDAKLNLKPKESVQ